MSCRLHRRAFLGRAGSAGLGVFVLGNSRSARGYAANEKLNIALVGVGGRGSWFVGAIPRIGENVVAMCDVNAQRAAASFGKLPGVPKYHDFRKMLEEKDRQIDAVIVATPDNTHAVVTAAAMKMGKHVYCEKPLTHDVAESRAVRQLARKCRVATQMGNQGTATEAFRRAVELVQAGVLGTVKEVHVWSGGGSGPRKRPEGSQPVPDWLHWDLWLGPAADRPFHPAWLGWHAWRDFATSNLGNWGCHSGNLPFKALKIDTLWRADPGAGPAPKIRLGVEVSEVERMGFPRWASLRYEIPARGDLPPVVVNWHNGAPGGRKRVEDLIGRRLDWGDAGAKKWKEHAGCLVVGTEGMIKSTEHNSSFTLLPAEKFAGFEGPPRTLPRSGSHEREWIRACKGGPPAMSNFDYAGPLAELVLLGNVATLVGRTIEYDPLACKVSNDKEADRALRREYRKGWSL